MTITKLLPLYKLHRELVEEADVQQRMAAGVQDPAIKLLFERSESSLRHAATRLLETLHGLE